MQSVVQFNVDIADQCTPHCLSGEILNWMLKCQRKRDADVSFYFLFFLSSTHLIQTLPGLVAWGKQGKRSGSLNLGPQLRNICVILGWGCFHQTQGAIHMVNRSHWKKTFTVGVIRCQHVFLEREIRKKTYGASTERLCTRWQYATASSFIYLVWFQK